MFGLYYAVIGMFSGAICSFLAYKKFRNQKDWYALGQILPIIALIILLLLPSKKEVNVVAEYSSNKNTIEPIYKVIA